MKTSFPPLKINLRDPSTLLLIASNVTTIVLAITEGWSFATLIWTYWIQSVIIGILNAVRIFSLQRFSTAGMLAGGQPVPETPVSKIGTGIFFIFHYGMFHLVYALFLGDFLGEVQGRELLIGAGIFFINHLFSFFQHRQEDARSVPSLGMIMVRPYFRIFPIHLVLCFAIPLAHNAIALTVFLIIKGVFDVLAHAFEHTQSLMPPSAPLPPHSSS